MGLTRAVCHLRLDVGEGKNWKGLGKNSQTAAGAERIGGENEIHRHFGLAELKDAGPQ